ncbi:MAG: S41 family peptidase [Bacteroidota bacterium]|nr:S41 family peptidase [Candidatus Kapabacteria bacterium]MDW8220619.1 S41 family peptidase [Bacteroidota bacterium]
MNRRSLLVAICCIPTALLLSFCAQQPTNPVQNQSSSDVPTQWFANGRITDIYSNTNAANLNLPDFLYLGMRDIYYWHTRVPQNLNVAAFPTPDSLLRFTMVRPEDRFSEIVEDGIGYYNRLTMGTSSPIFGFASAFLGNGEVRITRVLGGSSAEKAGLRRGMRIISVDGQAVPATASAWLNIINNLGMTTTIVAEDREGKRLTANLMRTVFNEVVVPVVQTFTVAGKKVGYMVFTSYTQSAINELQTAFATLKKENVSELILDLRYNGGGSVNTAGALCSHIASQLAGTVYVRLTYNSRYAVNNQQATMTNQPNGLSLNRLFVITTNRTASASELTINALRPFIDVKTVGSRSFGKPVGSNIVIHRKSGYMLLLTSFSYYNAVGQADFLNGFAPDIPAEDDLTRDFGDPEEASLRAALYFIQHGRAPAVAKSAQYASTPPMLVEEQKGISSAILLP